MLIDIITAYRHSAALHAFVKLGIPIRMGRAGPMSLDDLSTDSHVDANRLSRLLDKNPAQLPSGHEAWFNVICHRNNQATISVNM